MTYKRGDKINVIYTETVAGQPVGVVRKPATVRSYWRGLTPKDAVITVEYDDGSPVDAVPPANVEVRK